MTTLADGTLTVIIAPNGCFSGAFTVNAPQLPFICVSGASSTLPYSAIAYGAAGPFNSQYSNMSTVAVDMCSIDFQ